MKATNVSKFQYHGFDQGFRPEVQESALYAFFFWHGALIEGVQVFSHDQNDTDLLGAYVTGIYCSLSVKINPREKSHGRKISTRTCAKVMDTFLLAFFFQCLQSAYIQVPPTWSFMAEDANTHGSIGGLVSPV